MLLPGNRPGKHWSGRSCRSSSMSASVNPASQSQPKFAGGRPQVHPVAAPVGQAGRLPDQQERRGGDAPHQRRRGDGKAVVLAPSAPAYVLMEQFQFLH